MKRLLLLLLCTFLCQELYSQAGKSSLEGRPVKAVFSSDRPGAGSDAASLLEAGFWQIESGTQYSLDRKESANRKYTVEDFQIMNSLLRIGLLPNLEFRLAFTYQYFQSGFDEAASPLMGFAPLSLGTKIGICEEKGLRPKISASMGVSLPSTGRKEFQVAYVIPAITFLTETTLTDYLSLTGNFGAEWDAEEVQSVGTYAVSADAALSPHWGAFVELYGTVPERGTADHLFDAGFVYLARPNLQFDISSGIAFTEAAPDCFFGVGLSWMFDTHL